MTKTIVDGYFEGKHEGSNCHLESDRSRWEGNLEVILNGVGTLILDSGKERDFDLMMNIGRIIQCLSDYKIAHPSKAINHLYSKGLDLGLELMRGENESIYSLDTFYQEVEEFDKRKMPLYRTKLGDNFIRFCVDEVSFVGMHPEKSKRTAQRILKLTDNPLLFLAFGNSGVIPGMDVFHKINRDQSVFYATRFSRHKHQDSRPKLNRDEINYLGDVLGGRDLVLFDEDVSSGETFREARDYFERQFGKRRIILATNFNKNHIPL